MDLAVVILAAGKGTRMNSDITKVCHKVGNKTMIEHVTNTANKLSPKNIVVVVSKDNIEDTKKVLNHVKFKIQEEQLGTAHAVLVAVPCCNENSDLLVLLGDVPLISSKTLSKVVNTNYDAVIIGFKNHDPTNRLGRIVINNNRVNKIVEYLDATPEERSIPLCNSGMLWIKSSCVPLLSQIGNDNVKGEYYLTDIIKIMTDKGLKIGFFEASFEECMGVNNPSDLAEVNKIYSDQ